MKAFVKVNHGTFPNINFYLAWEAFNTMGYEVTLFEEKDIPNLDISVETPVFAGVTIFRKVIDKLGIVYPPFDCYPMCIKDHYSRNLRKAKLGETKTQFLKDGIPIFVKPVLPKQFIGNVWKSMLNLIPLANVPEDADVWVCEPIKIMSEFRVYVNEGEILGVKHYYGDWSIVPDKEYVERVVKEYTPCPIAHGIDIAVTRRDGGIVPGGTMLDPRGFHYHPLVLEVNDGCNLGNYGLDAIHYGEMIVSRWYEIVQQGGSDEKLRQRLMNPLLGNMTDRLASVDYEDVERKMEQIRNSLKKAPYVSEEEIVKLGY